jgi:hypothetical protein
MRWRSGLLLAAMLLPGGCWLAPSEGLKLEQLPARSDWQLQARPISVPEYMRLRLGNRPRKAPVGQWLIVHQDETFVYIGSPRFRGLFSDQREVLQLYRLSRFALQQHLPAYADFDGLRVWQQLMDLLPAADRAGLTREALAQVQISPHPEGWQLQLPLSTGAVTLLLDPVTLSLRLL